MTTTDHEALRELAGDYVAGALTDSERQAFVAHLEHCRECQRETRELARVAEGLGQALDPREPPAALRARVLAAATTPPAEVTSIAGPTRATRRAMPWAVWLTAAASIAAIASGLLAWRYRGEADQMRTQLTALQHRMTTMSEQMASLQTSATSARQTSAILTAADLARVDLSGQSPAPVASGRVFWSASNGLVFSAANLPPLPPGRVYQLWIVGEAPLSAGVVTPDASGRVNVITGTPVAARPKAFALTIEPEGGRPAPTGPMFLLGAV